MMNEHGKSDRPVVPAKSPNKAGQPAAEGMEGSGLTKGNLPQQSASRTPSREDAPSALERVLQAAVKEKKLQFMALLHHIYNPETLRTAYFSLKKEAAPGVDGETWRHAISHEWLVKFIEHWIAERRVVRLIQKWLNAGVLEDGKRIRVEEGTPQGGSASPLLANVYLHYVFDLWVQA
jgi:hypothetical protein